MKDKIVISLDSTIGIREFMEHYLEVDYTEEGNITHEKMNRFLFEKGYVIPQVLPFKKVTTSKILSGEVLFVRAESSSRNNVDYKSKRGKILAYVNPLRESLEKRLLREIQSGAYKEDLISDPGFELRKKRKNNKYKNETR